MRLVCQACFIVPGTEEVLRNISYYINRDQHGLLTCSKDKGHQQMDFDTPDRVKYIAEQVA